MVPLPDIVTLSLRTVSFVADLQAAGVAMFLVLFGNSLSKSRNAIRALGKSAAAAGLFFTLAQYLFEPARMMGAMSGLFDGSLHAMLLSTDVATSVAIRIFGLILVLLGLLAANRTGEMVSLIGASLVAFSFALIGHTAAHDLRWALVVLLVSHLIIVTLWFGALLPLIIASMRESTDTTSAIIDAFSFLAAWAVPIIFVAGLGMSIVLLEELNNLWTPYGISLLLKVAGFTVLMGLAALNKWRLGPAIASGHTGSLTAFRRSVAAEWFLIAGVLAVTAVMTGLFSPTD